MELRFFNNLIFKNFFNIIKLNLMYNFNYLNLNRFNSEFFLKKVFVHLLHLHKYPIL